MRRGIHAATIHERCNPLQTDWFNLARREPRIVIGPGAVVQGKLKFEHEVELLVSDRAKIGPVEGAKAVMFSGNEPGRAEQEVERK